MADLSDIESFNPRLRVLAREFGKKRTKKFAQLWRLRRRISTDKKNTLKQEEYEKNEGRLNGR